MHKSGRCCLMSCEGVGGRRLYAFMDWAHRSSPADVSFSAAHLPKAGGEFDFGYISLTVNHGCCLHSLTITPFASVLHKRRRRFRASSSAPVPLTAHTHTHTHMHIHPTYRAHGRRGERNRLGNIPRMNIPRMLAYLHR